MDLREGRARLRRGGRGRRTRGGRDELVRAGEANVFAAEVSAGWWRDKIVTPANKGGGFFGRKSAFRGVIELTYADGTTRLVGTDAKGWKAGTGGPVVHAAKRRSGRS